MIDAKEVKVGLIVLQKFAGGRTEKRTIIPNFKSPVRDHPNQKFAVDGEVYLDTVLNNTYFFETFHINPTCSNCLSSDQVNLRDPLDEGGSLWNCRRCNKMFHEPIKYKQLGK